MKTQNLKQVKVNFSTPDYEYILAIANSENISMAQFIRDKLSVKIDNPPIKKSIVVYKKSDPKLLFLLNSIRISINEVAKKVDSKNEFGNIILFEIYKKVMSLQ